MTPIVLNCLIAAALALAPAQRGKGGAPPRAATAAPIFVYFGTYTVRESKGIYGYRFKAGLFAPLGASGLVAESSNPSYLAVDPSGRYIYAVNENEKEDGTVSAFALNRRTGVLTFLNKVSSGGSGPCYVAVDPRGRHVLVANYGSGSVTVFKVGADGRLGTATAFEQHQGSSVNSERQEGPHAHQILVAPGGPFALAADLGLDQIKVYKYDSATGQLAPNDPPFGAVDPGSGPRHFVFDRSGRFVYVLNEIHSTITTFAFDPILGTLKSLQNVEALPKSYVGENSAAEIMLGRGGRFVYASIGGRTRSPFSPSIPPSNA